jgi:hypothetical protein
MRVAVPDTTTVPDTIALACSSAIDSTRLPVAAVPGIGSMAAAAAAAAAGAAAGSLKSIVRSKGALDSDQTHTVAGASRALQFGDLGSMANRLSAAAGCDLNDRPSDNNGSSRVLSEPCLLRFEGSPMEASANPHSSQDSQFHSGSPTHYAMRPASGHGAGGDRHHKAHSPAAVKAKTRSRRGRQGRSRDGTPLMLQQDSKSHDAGSSHSLSHSESTARLPCN